MRGVDAVEGDGRVAAEAGAFVDGSAFTRGDDRVLFSADDEERFARFEAIESFEIEVATIHEIEGSGFDGQEIECVDIVQFPLGNVDETGNVAAEIDQRVQFDGAFTATKFRPGEEFQTEVDGRGIEGVNGFAEGGRERFVRVERSGPTDQDVGEVGEDAPIVNAVGIGERASRNVRAKAGVVAFFFDGMQAGFDVAKTFAVGELGEGHGQELIATGEPAMSAMVAVTTNARVEIVTRQVVHQLREDELTRKHVRCSTIGNENPEVDCDRGS